MSKRWWSIPVIALSSSVVVLVAHGRWPGRRTPAYEPSPQNDAMMARLVNGALTFVLLHESGHMMIRLFDLPHIGSEEDEADHFAAAALTVAMNSDQADPTQRREFRLALMSGAMFFRRLHQDDLRTSRAPAWSDEHGEPEQRAFNIICMLYGRSPHEFGQFAREAGLPPQRLASCPTEAQRNQADWQRLIGDAYRKANPPAASELADFVVKRVFYNEEHKVALFLAPVPADLAPAVRARLMHGRQLAQQGDALRLVMAVMRLAPSHFRFTGSNDPIVNDYKLIGSPCLGSDGAPIENAWWSASTASITFCYGLVASIEDKARQDVVEGDRPMQQALAPAS